MPCSFYWDISSYINEVEIWICNDLTRSDGAGSVVWSEATNHSRSISQSINQSSASVMCVSDVCVWCVANVRRGVRYRDLVFSAYFMPKHLWPSLSVMMTKCPAVRNATPQPWRPHSEHTRSPTDDYIREKTDSQHIRFTSLNNKHSLHQKPPSEQPPWDCSLLSVSTNVSWTEVIPYLMSRAAPDAFPINQFKKKNTQIQNHRTCLQIVLSKNPKHISFTSVNQRTNTFIFIFLNDKGLYTVAMLSFIH